jgi:hypothetical protein
MQPPAGNAANNSWPIWRLHRRWIVCTYVHLCGDQEGAPGRELACKVRDILSTLLNRPEIGGVSNMFRIDRGVLCVILVDTW